MATAGGRSFLLTVYGGNFVASSTANWNGAALPTDFVSASQLTAIVPASDIATAGAASVTVVNPPPSGTSGAASFAILEQNPVPVISSSLPCIASAGGADFSLTVVGSGFVSSSVVDWNGAAVATSFVSASLLTAQIPASDITSAGSATITVVNPAPGGGTSNRIIFPITDANLIFVTSTTYAAGALGGLAGADAICQMRATDAGLTGTYRAWLSTNGTGATNAITRLGTSRGWVRPDGKPFIDTTTDLANGRLMYPPRVDEFGVDLGSRDVLTNTAADGTLATTANTCCANYTSTTSSDAALGGSSSAGETLFTAYFGLQCNEPANLYCFEVGRTTPVTATPTAGRRAFVSDEFFVSGGGITAADAICASEASAAGLSGTYLAALATITSSVQSRFETSGAPWVRADGLPLASTAQALFSGAMMDTPPVVNASGTKWYESTAWNGALSWTSTGTMASTCNNYTSTSGSGQDLIWISNTNPSLIFDSDSFLCSSSSLRLLCLQE